MFNPWPCTPLQTGVKILAGIDGVITVIRIILNIVLINVAAEVRAEHGKGDDILSERLRKALYTLKIVTIFFIILLLLELALAVFLFLGASRKNYSHCRIWLIIVGILSILCTLRVFSAMTSEALFMETGDEILTKFQNAGIATTAAVVVAWMFTIYEMIVVFAFLQELRPPGMILGQPGVGYGYPTNVNPAPDQIPQPENPPPHDSQTKSVADNP